MDPMQQVLASARIRSPLIADLRLGDDVSLGIPHLPGIPFHYVAEGSCRLSFQARSVGLEAGDFAMLPRWPSYRLETGRALEHVEILDFRERQGLPPDYLQASLVRPLLTVVGSASPAARVLSGIAAFAGQEGGPLTRDLPELMLLRGAEAQLEPWLVAAIEFISAEGYEPEPGFGAVAERLIELIFVAMLRRWFLRSAHEAGWMRGLGDPIVSRALGALHTEPGRHWTLRDLAAASGQSRSGFAEHFRRVVGETPFAYLARWRMHLAATLVRQGRRSTDDISASLGYRSSRAFSRAFLLAHGETPAQHRRRGRAERIDGKTAF